jgi:hypothetical protein
VRELLDPFLFDLRLCQVYWTVLLVAGALIAWGTAGFISGADRISYMQFRVAGHPCESC